jgi:hypothetical protein
VERIGSSILLGRNLEIIPKDGRLFNRYATTRRNIFENEVAILTASNAEFLKETRSMGTWLDVDRLYLSKKASGAAPKLVPLVQWADSQICEKCMFFFSRLEQDGTRFISYHYIDQPELRGQFDEATETIKFLMAE